MGDAAALEGQVRYHSDQRSDRPNSVHTGLPPFHIQQVDCKSTTVLFFIHDSVVATLSGYIRAHKWCLWICQQDWPNDQHNHVPVSKAILLLKSQAPLVAGTIAGQLLLLGAKFNSFCYIFNLLRRAASNLQLQFDNQAEWRSGSA